MQVHNVHERVLDVSAAAVGPLLDGIGGPHDALWPSPEWSPLWLDGPPAVGTAGGHGALRYRVTTYEPGRRIVFTLDPGQDLSGWHGFEIVPRGPDRAVLRHVVAGRARGAMRLLWPCVVRPVHDGIVEQILDRAEGALGTGPASRPGCPRSPGSRGGRPTAGPCDGPRDHGRAAGGRLRRRVRRPAATGHADGSGAMGSGDLRQPAAAGCGRCSRPAKRRSGWSASNGRDARRSPSGPIPRTRRSSAWTRGTSTSGQW